MKRSRGNLVLVEQFGMSADAGDPPLVEHDDPVGVNSGVSRWATTNTVAWAVSARSAARSLASV